MELRAGTRLKSAVCTTEVIIVKPPAGGGELRCGGAPMTGPGDTAAEGLTLSPDAANGTLLGKRYVNDEAGLEVLCTKPGDGSLALGDVALEIQGAKALPPSD